MRGAYGMNKSDRAKKIVSDMERITPYMYEGLYGSFFRIYMDSDKSKWSKDLSQYLSQIGIGINILIYFASDQLHGHIFHSFAWPE